jgi:hypothetical protein
MKATAADTDTVRALMRDIDHTLLRENLKLTFEQRARKHCACCKWFKNCGARAKSCDRKVMAVDLAQVGSIGRNRRGNPKGAQFFSATRAC